MAPIRLVQRALLLALELQPRGLGAVIHDRFPEPGVFEGVFGRDAFGGVVQEDAAEEVEELLVEGIGAGDDLLDGSKLDIGSLEKQRAKGLTWSSFIA